MSFFYSDFKKNFCLMINSCFFVILTGGCLSKTEIKPFDGEASKSALAILGSWTLDRLRFEAQGFSLVDEKTEAENSVIKIEMDHLTVSSYCISPEDKLIQIPLEISVPVTVTEKIVKTLGRSPVLTDFSNNSLYVFSSS